MVSGERATVTASDKKKAARGPESAYFDTLKGQPVLIDMHGFPPPDSQGALEVPLQCRLLWVDRYTIGVRVRNGRERMIYKKFIRGIERDDQDAIRDGTANGY